MERTQRKIKNILIVNTGARGDVLRTSGILSPLLRKFNHSSISWVVGEESYEVLEDNALLERVIIYRREEPDNFRSILDTLHLDLIINLEEDPCLAELLNEINTEIIGFIVEKGLIIPTASAVRYWEMGLYGPRPDNNILKKNNRMTYQDMLKEILTLDHYVACPEIKIGLTEEKMAVKLISKKIKNDNILIGINFGSGSRWPTKRLPLGLVINIIEAMEKKDNIKILIFAGEDEKKEARMLLEKFPGLTIAQSVPYKVFAALIHRCRLLITTDTFALHIAIAVGTEVLAYFGPTSAYEIELYGLGEKFITSLECSCCYKKNCNKEPFCMDDFSIVENIEARLTGLIDRLN
ncbi:glycosyltransferase family 9 protein [Elusimicrobiota bacterium]